MSQQGPQFSPHSKAKANDNCTNLRKNVSTSIDVEFASVYSEKSRLNKCLIMIIMIIMNKSQETTFFWWAPEFDFHYKTKSRKVMVDFKFDALYR